MTQNHSKTLYLIDISSFIFRAFFAVRSLSNKKGEPTNAVYGVANMLSKLVADARPEFGAVVYDSKEPSFRKTMYEAYKANRSAPPEDLVPQFDRIEQLVASLGIPSFRQSGIEADDLIATLTYRWLEMAKDHHVVVVTGDKDLMQLVNDRVVVWDTMNDKRYAEEQVREKFGVEPGQIRDYLALIGDSSDNIPGVTGIGPKGAVDLLKQFGTLPEILAAAKAGKVAGKKGQALQEHEKDALISAELATLKGDLSVNASVDTLKFRFDFSAECQALLKELDFHKLVDLWSKKMLVPASPEEVAVSTAEPAGVGKFITIDNEEKWKTFFARLEKSQEFGFDLETTSLNPRQAQIVGIAIALGLEESFYIPVGHVGENVIQLPRDFVLRQLKPILENPKYKKIGQNLKYDWSVLIEQGIQPDGLGADTMVASYLIEPEGRHNLDTLAQKYLDYSVLKYEDVCGKGKDQISFAQVSVDVATKYSAEDAWIAVKLWETLKPELQNRRLMEVFARIDLPLVPVLTKMELQGVCLDLDWLRQLSVEFDRELQQITERVHAYSPEPINLNSTKQLAQLLFEELKLPTQSRTKTGFSTDASVLEILAPMHEVPRLLLEYREIAKLKGTYVDPLPLMIDEKTGKIHAGFHQTVAATGRLSSADPNLQNIPVRTERGRMIRRAFIPSPGNVLVSADYSQIELRILAHMSGDEDLCRSFQLNEDVHRRTASEIFRIAPEAVSDHQRDIAKAINFGLMYGKTAFGLAQELRIPRREAQETIERYFARYRGVKNFLDHQIIDAKEKGWAMTLLGRKRNLPDLNSRNPAVRANAERMAMNTPIQGTAADLIKIAMIDLDQELERRGYAARLTIQVHDELVLDCPKAEVEKVTALLVEVMEGALKLNVPLKVNTSVGENWREL